MENFCHFHPASAAKWRCNKCHRYFDHACAIPVSDHTKTPTCPVCKAALKSLQTEDDPNSEVSLLNGVLFTSPFILLICVMILVAAVSSFAPIPPAILVLLNLLAVLFTSLQYGRQTVFSKVALYEARSASNRAARSIRHQHSSLPGLQDSLKSTIPFAIVYLLPVYIFYQLHWLAGLLLMLVAASLIHYMLFFLLHQLDTRHQLDSKKIFAFLNSYKSRLIPLSLFLYFTCLIILDFAFIHITGSIALMLDNAFVTLSLVILYYQHARIYRRLIREVDVVTVEGKNAKSRVAESKQGVSKFTASEKPSDKHPQLSTEIELALKTGHYQHAVSLLEHALKQNPHSILRRQQLYLLLTELNDLEKLSQHAELFLNWMLDRGKIREASQFLYRLRKHDPQFILYNLALKAELARLFARQKKHALVLWLAESCRKHLAPGEELATIYLSASQVLVTHYQDLAKAEEYLLFIIKHCAACESAEAAKALLIHLQNNQQREQQLRE